MDHQPDNPAQGIRSLLATALAVTLFAVAGDPANAAPASRQFTDRADVVLVQKGDAHMRRASAKARSELDGFLQRMRKPGADDHGFSVKVGFTERGHTEYMWVNDIEEKDGRFEGRLGSHPRFSRKVSAGQTIRFRRHQIVDWLYREGSTMRGNYTTCALFAGPWAAMRAEYERANGLRCQ